MSKKTKEKSGYHYTQLLDPEALSELNRVTTMVQPSGFLELHPTPDHAEFMRLAEEHKKLGKKAKEKPVEKEDEEEYDPKDAEEDILALQEYAKAGKYEKGSNKVPCEKIKKFVKKFLAEKDEEKGKEYLPLVKTLLAIAKSYYEFANDICILHDETYDGLIEHFKKLGGTEPAGIIPKGKKNLKKTDVKYPLLHNNMDKAYAILEDDPIPEGVKEADTIERFLTRVYKACDLGKDDTVTLELSPKLDGVSINGTITDDCIVDVQTRGDEDQSIAVPGLNNLQVSDEEVDEPFGAQFELFVTKEDVPKVSEYLKLDTPYVSCRHAASGILHRLSTMEDDGLLEFVSLYPINTEGMDGTYTDRVKFLENKLAIVPEDMIPRKVVTGDFKELLSKITKTFKKLNDKRDDLSYAIDGMVITCASDEMQETLGRNGRTNKYQIALKFEPATAIGIVDSIYLDSGKKGYRTIQVKLKEPVYLDGVEYSHIPILSVDIFKDLALRKGTKVSIHRVGDVIPALSVVEAGYGVTVKLIDTCPECGEKLTVKNGKLYCSNVACEGNVIGRFVNFFNVLDMTSYSKSFAVMLHTKLGIKSIQDMIELTDDKIKESGINSKQLIDFPKDLRTALSNHYDYEILAAMGVPGLGKENAKKLLKEISFHDLVCTLDKDAMSYEKRVQYYSNHTKEIGNHARDKKRCTKIISDAYQYMVNSETVFNDLCALNALNLMKFYKNEPIRSLIGHTGGNVSERFAKCARAHCIDIVDGKNFSILIAKDKDSDSAKIQYAKAHNIPIYTEKEFEVAFNNKTL